VNRFERSRRVRGVACALSAAVMFGVSTPLVRPVLARTDVAASAGYLYLGQALVLSLWWLASRRAGRRVEADLDRKDLAPLGLGIVAGGLIAPGAFTAGLALVPAHQVSLLLGLETVFTLLIALAFRHERLSGGAWIGIGLLLGAGALVSLPAGSAKETALGTSLAGSLLVALACAGWAVDSNLTAGISGKDPTAISLLKGWAASASYLGGCLILGRQISALPGDLVTLLVAGAIGYGLSLRFFILALRSLGAAQTTALFSTAPIVGFAASVAFLGERPAAGRWIAFLLAVAGVLVVALGRHEHEHVHGEVAHEHPHIHDEHHDHEHRQGTESAAGHAHAHVHGRLVHTHPHDSDQDHTHRH